MVMAEERREGSSRTSASRSALRDRRSALRRRSRIGFSEALVLLLRVVKSETASSSLGMVVVSLSVSAAREGRVVRRWARWSEEAITALWEREERALRERSVELAVWDRAAGSESVKEGRGRVRRRVR